MDINWIRIALVNAISLLDVRVSIATCRGFNATTDLLEEPQEHE
jgi:hypothetical protein